MQIADAKNYNCTWLILPKCQIISSELQSQSNMIQQTPNVQWVGVTIRRFRNEIRIGVMVNSLCHYLCCRPLWLTLLLARGLPWMG